MLYNQYSYIYRRYIFDTQVKYSSQEGIQRVFVKHIHDFGSDYPKLDEVRRLHA